MTYEKEGLRITVACTTSPVPQICVVASNVVQHSKVTIKVTKGQWSKVR
jgi:diaminopimelate epimerase